MDYEGVIKEQGDYKIEYRECNDIKDMYLPKKMKQFFAWGYVLSGLGTFLLNDIPRIIFAGIWFVFSVGLGCILIFGGDIFASYKLGMRIYVTGNDKKEIIGEFVYTDDLDKDKISLGDLIKTANDKITDFQLEDTKKQTELEKYNSYREQLLQQ